MAHGYEAVFEPGTSDLPTVLADLPFLLSSHGLVYGGQVYQLERERDGTLNVTDLAPVTIPLEELEGHVRRWQGFSLALVSEELLAAVGRGDAMEVDLRISHKRGREIVVGYREAGMAWRARRDDVGLQRALCRKLLAFAALAGAARAVYDEETAAVVPDQVSDVIERVIASGRFPSGGDDGVLLLPVDETPAVLQRFKRSEDVLVRSISGSATAVNLL